MYKILVAEDENIERKVLLKKLRAKYEGTASIYEAENGREALRIYREEEVKILILDIEMPGITGLQAASEIRREDKDAVIIFLTAFDEFSYAKKAVSVHALDYLLKPYDDKELFLSVDTAMHYVDEIDQGKLRSLPVRGDERVLDGSRDRSNAVQEPENSSIRNGRKLMMDYVEKHYMEDISVQDIAGALNYSEAYFCKLFKQQFGTNFVSFLSEYRITRAKELLSGTHVNIKDIGKTVGYPDSNYFAKVFKRIAGKSPSEYRAEILEE
ncbi:MAG: response regulator [Oribacterium sp.]|nr:response regulator [Oribacterium sp.]